MKIRLFGSIVLLASATVVHAGNFFWGSTLGGGDGRAWEMSENWYTGGGFEKSPGAGDHVLIENRVYNNSIETMPVLCSAVSDVAYLTWGWESPGSTSLTIKEGGFLAVKRFARLGHKVGSLGSLDMTGGTMVVNALQVGFNSVAESAGGSGVVNLSGRAILHAGTFSVGQMSADYDEENPKLSGTGVVNIDGGALLIVNGDCTAEGWISSGYIVAAKSNYSIVGSYNAALKRTEFVCKRWR